MFCPQRCHCDLCEECLNIKSIDHVNPTHCDILDVQRSCECPYAEDAVIPSEQKRTGCVDCVLLCVLLLSSVGVPRVWGWALSSLLCVLSHSQKSSIRVSFRPALSDQQIREEAEWRLSAAAVPEAGAQVRNAKNSTCCWSATSRYLFLWMVFLS